MTGIGATGGPGFGRQASIGRRGDSGDTGSDADARTFTDALLTIDARAGSGRHATSLIAGGTMRPATEAFGAHGLFDGSVPVVAVRSGAGPDDTAPAAAALAGAGQSVTSAPIPAMVAAPSIAADAIATPASGLPTALRSSAAGPLVHLLSSGPAVVSRAGILEPEVPAATTAGAGAGGEAPSLFSGALAGQVETALDEACAARSRPAPADGGAASRFAVSLDADEHGVVVTVTGAVPTDEEEVVHQAAARLLARHGLVMNTLRIARHPSAERRHQGNR